MRKVLLLSGILAFACFKEIRSQGLYEVPLEEKIKNSSVIIEGKVVLQFSFWNDQRTMIYTSNKIEVFKIFKGNLSTDTIEVLTQGGSVAEESIEATHLLKLDKNDFGIFFCQPNSIGLSYSETSSILYDVYASSQGFLKYDPSNKKASAPFTRYDDIEKELYPELQNKIGKPYREIKNFRGGSLRGLQTLAVNITGFSPATVNAGAILDPSTNVLTITGSGFGSASGMAAVFFDDANDGPGGNLTGVDYTSPLMISWSATSIQLRVPTNAGTGAITVRDDAGATGTTSSFLNVGYSILTANFTDPGTSISYVKESNLINDNGSGGYTILYSTATAGSGIDITTSPALSTFQRALTTWKEMTGLNIVEGVNTSSQVINPSDDQNVIMFDNSNTGMAALPAGVLAVCYSFNGICSGDYVNNQAVKTEFDIVIRNSGYSLGNTAFTFGPCPPNSTDFNQIDLETVLLHELGHALNLGHIIDGHTGGSVGVINPGKLMNYAVVNSVKRSTPDYSAKSGALYAINPQSNAYGICGITEMVPLAVTSTESKDDCPLNFPTTTIAQNTSVAFNMVQATSNKYVDPAYTQFRCDGLGGAQTNNAYYAFRTNSNSGALLLSVNSYTTTPGSLSGCSQIYAGVPVTGFRLSLYQVNSCPIAGAFPAPTACATITGNGSLAPINGLTANTNYLLYVEGFENTKANFNLVFGGTVLPIKLTSFTGEMFDDYNQLQWKAESAINVAKIFVQKSADGINFENIGQVIRHEEFMDGKMNDPLPYSKTYYRLAIVNTNSSMEYSNIVVLKRKLKNYITVYPNPAAEFINVQINSGSPAAAYTIKLYNHLGQLVTQVSGKWANQTVRMPIDLPNGMYQLELSQNNIKLESHKILVKN